MILMQQVGLDPTICKMSIESQHKSYTGGDKHYSKYGLL